MTRDGRQIGTVHDVYIDPDTGHVEGYEVRERVFAGLVSRLRVLPRSGDVTIGPDVVIVSSEAAAQLEAQPADGHRDVPMTTVSVPTAPSPRFQAMERTHTGTEWSPVRRVA